jgi:hypothetical protein
MQLVVRPGCQRTCCREVSLTSFSSEIADLGEIAPKSLLCFHIPQSSLFRRHASEYCCSRARSLAKGMYGPERKLVG